MEELVKFEKGYYSIKHGRFFGYDFELDRCDTYEKLISWISHLTRKTWVTSSHIKQLINEFESVTGLPTYINV